MRRLRSLALPTLSGVLYFLSWVGFGIWPLAFVCFVPLVFALRNATPAEALRRGAWFGFVAHLGGYTWMIHLLRLFAFAPLPLAFLGYVLLCLVQGLLFGVCAWTLRRAWTATRWPLAILLPVALVATEFVYPLLFQSYTGVALMPLLPLVQIADLGGVLLLSALQAAINGALADVMLTRRPWPVVGTALVVVVATLYGLWRIARIDAREQNAPSLRIGLAQPNVGEIALHKNPYASVQALWADTAELHARGAEIVVWPEVGYNLRPVRDGDDGRAIQGGIPVAIVAGVERARGKEAWNSAIAIEANGKIGDHYDKIQLLAFGEYIPFGDWFPFLYEWSPLATHLTPGVVTAPLRLKGYRFATFICYEDILPWIVRKTMANHGEGRAHALVNLTNDSWYGAGHEQEQHLQLAAVRTIEHRRWLLRATSTGISAFVDATGRVVTRIPPDVRGVAVRDVPMLQGTTVYEVAGDWPGWAALAALAFVAARELRKRRRRRR